jgi:glycerophosphoryl diester phosphodiesterase
MIAIPITIALLFLVYLFLVAPKNRKEMDRFKNIMYAHRGLHNAERAENSMSAFKSAVANGYGIELDIRLSKDGELVVFHDDTLDRVCGREGRVIDFTADELAAFKLSGTNDGIPKFSDVLALVNGRVPLLVEIKEDAGNSAVSRAACKMLKDYKGEYIVESFNPLSLKTVKENMPSITRGILSHRYYAYENYRKPLYMLLQLLLLNRVCKPAFVAYDHHHAGSVSLKVARLLGATTFAWTVRSEAEAADAYKNGFDSIIFENFLPEK